MPVPLPADMQAAEPPAIPEGRIVFPAVDRVIGSASRWPCRVCGQQHRK